MARVLVAGVGANSERVEMSYARFGSDSSVYVFETCGGVFECCGCESNFETSGLIIAHLNEHRAKGDLVPDYTYEQIILDHPNLDAKIS